MWAQISVSSKLGHFKLIKVPYHAVITGFLVFFYFLVPSHESFVVYGYMPVGSVNNDVSGVIFEVPPI
jgi:hypothetical protein